MYEMFYQQELRKGEDEILLYICWSLFGNQSNLLTPNKNIRLQ
jgi:hypothetical protein